MVAIYFSCQLRRGSLGKHWFRASGPLYLFESYCFPFGNQHLADDTIMEIHLFVILLHFTGPPVPITARMHSTPQRPFVYVYVYVYASTTYPTPSKLARGYTTTAEGDTYVEHSHSQLSSQVAQAHHRALIHQVSLAKRVEVSPACFCQSQHREPALRARAALRLHSALPCVAIIRF